MATYSTRGSYNSLIIIKMKKGPVLAFDNILIPYLYFHRPATARITHEDTALSILDAVIGGRRIKGEEFGQIAPRLVGRFVDEKLAGMKLCGWEMMVGEVLDWVARQPEAMCGMCQAPGLAVALCKHCEVVMCLDCVEDSDDYLDYLCKPCLVRYGG